MNRSKLDSAFTAIYEDIKKEFTSKSGDISIDSQQLRTVLEKYGIGRVTFHKRVTEGRFYNIVYRGRNFGYGTAVREQTTRPITIDARNKTLELKQLSIKVNDLTIEVKKLRFILDIFESKNQDNLNKGKLSKIFKIIFSE